MAQFSSHKVVLSPEDKHHYLLTLEQRAMPLNCGVRVIGSLFLYKQRDTVWQDRLPTISRKELYAVLDKGEAHLVMGDGVPGYAIITDRIGPDMNADMEVHDTAKLNVDSPWRTQHFVQWLIDRQHGIVYRGPITENHNYPGHSAIVSWIWVPNSNYLLDSSIKCYATPERLASLESVPTNIRHFPKLNDEDKAHWDYPKLWQSVKDYVTVELKRWRKVKYAFRNVLQK